MIPLLTIAQERILGGSLILVGVVLLLLWVMNGWYRLGVKPPAPDVKRSWTQRERDEFEALRRINDKEKR